MKNQDSLLTGFVRNDVLENIQASDRLPEPLRNGHLYVTGGTGFLGSWILEFVACLNDDHGFNTKVTATTRSLESVKTSLPHLSGRKKFSFVESDVRYLSELPMDVTHIIHAAALTNRNQFATNPTMVSDNNINSTLRIFRLAQQAGSIQNILLLSSGLVYGKQKDDSERITEESCVEMV
jgi:nucleoside-diphosphate-sugar epimerase